MEKMTDVWINCRTEVPKKEQIWLIVLMYNFFVWQTMTGKPITLNIHSFIDTDLYYKTMQK